MKPSIASTHATGTAPASSALMLPSNLVKKLVTVSAFPSATYALSQREADAECTILTCEPEKVIFTINNFAINTVFIHSLTYFLLNILSKGFWGFGVLGVGLF